MTITWDGFARPDQPSADARLISGYDVNGLVGNLRPKVSARVTAGRNVVAFGRGRRPRALVTLVAPVTSHVLARPLSARALVKLGEVALLSSVARPFRPRALINLALPLNIVILGRAPRPKVFGRVGPGHIALPLPTIAPVAVGSLQDMVRRLKAALPDRWFPNTGQTELTSNSPVLDGLLSGTAWVFEWLYGLLQYVAAQRRITTATDVNLDIISQDYFATKLPRLNPESDDTFRARIKANLLPPRNTRAAIVHVLTVLTGKAPLIFEPAYTMDTGGWGHVGQTEATGLVYNVLGGWGDLQLPFQAFITAFRPAPPRLASIGGYYVLGSGVGLGGYGVGALEYAALTDVEPQVSDATIYQTIADAAPEATIMWTRIHDPIPPLRYVTDSQGNIITDEYGNPISYN